MPKNNGYHHGNLAQTLTEAAVQLIAEVGPSGFTLREVARRAGVSHNAPYRHFKDRDDLLAAVAAQGFDELAEEMTGAAAEESDSLKRLKLSGLAYVSFALRHPEHFAVMFDGPVSITKNERCLEASNRAFSVLLEFVKDCQTAGTLPGGSTRDRALLAWSMVHGIAKLAVAERLPFKSTSRVLAFAEFVIDQSMGPGSARYRE